MYAGLIMPLLSRYAGKDEGAFAAHLRDGFDTLAVGFVGAAALSFAFAPDIAALIGGPEFAAAGPALQALTPLIALYPLSLVCRFAVTARDRQAELLRGYAVAAALGIAGLFVLIPLFGAIGAAGGLLIGETVVFATVLRVLRRSAGVLPSWSVLAKAAACAALACLLTLIPAVAELHWILRAGAVGVAYLVLLVVTGAVPAQLRAMLPLPKRLA
jgi:O-antigen/teichoic acid export membrane protein